MAISSGESHQVADASGPRLEKGHVVRKGSRYMVVFKYLPCSGTIHSLKVRDIQIGLALDSTATISTSIQCVDFLFIRSRSSTADALSGATQDLARAGWKSESGTFVDVLGTPVNITIDEL